MSLIIKLLLLLKLVMLTPDTYESEVSQGKSIVEFWAPWSQDSFSESDLIRARALGVKTYRVDLSKHPELGEKYEILMVPEYIFYEDGIEKSRFKGDLRSHKNLKLERL